MFPNALLARLVLVFAWCILPLVFSIELAGLLEDPTFSMGMISGFTRGAMDLTYLVQNFVTGLFKDPTISVGMIGRLVRGAMNLARPIKYSV